MAEESKSFNWQTGIALGGLLVSLFGNWIQFQSLADKKTELDQAQVKLKTYLEETKTRKESRESKKLDMEKRMHALDEQIEQADSDISRGLMGLAYGTPDQKAIASNLVSSGRARKAELSIKKQQLQDKIDSLPTD